MLLEYRALVVVGVIVGILGLAWLYKEGRYLNIERAGAALKKGMKEVKECLLALETVMRCYDNKCMRL